MLIDLHSHLEGRVRPRTAAELARDRGLPEPVGGWGAALELDEPGTLTDYLEKVAASYPLFGTYDAIRRIAFEAGADAARDGLDHLELRFGPTTHAHDGLGLRDVVAAAAEGLREAARVHSIACGLVLAALRHLPPERNEEVARLAATFAGDGVVGFDLAGDELRWPSLAPHATAFAIAGSAGLGLTCHAAEAAPAGAVKEAVTLLGATRIGHGAHLVEDPDVLAWAVDHGVVVEICPTSNWYTGAIARVEDHPARAMLAAGLALVLGDDNPVQTGSALPAERAVLRDRLGFTLADLERLDQTSIASAFVDDAQRHRWRG